MRQRQRPQDQNPLPPSLDLDLTGEEGLDLEIETPPGSGAAPEREGVVFNFGVHQYYLPARGLSVAEARALLAPRLNLDPEAVAVIRGEIVEDEAERVINDQVRMVSFVKRSSVKGAGSRADRIELAGAVTKLHLPRSVREIPTADVIETIQKETLEGFTEEALPPTVRWRVRCGTDEIYILELEPEIRALRWLASGSPKPFGPLALYQMKRLATPYVVLKVPFRKGRIHSTCELFYRSEPLRRLDERLHWSNLLNVSPHSYDCDAWICTQFLGRELMKLREKNGRHPTVVEQLDALHDHLWGGGFNRSSEEHEGRSCFSMTCEDEVDPRVTDVDRWEKESLKDWRFILDVPWTPTRHTVRTLIEKQLEDFSRPRDVADVSELTSALLACVHRRKRRVREGAA